jgi:hypothetical protein
MRLPVVKATNEKETVRPDKAGRLESPGRRRNWAQRKRKGPSRTPDDRLSARSPKGCSTRKLGTPSGSQTIQKRRCTENEPRWGDRTFEVSRKPADKPMVLEDIGKLDIQDESENEEPREEGEEPTEATRARTGGTKRE